MQVAGRAGRADRPGEVIIQTRTPDHYALRAVVERNYDAFAVSELAYRQEAAYPPFTRVTHAVVRARTDPAAESGADALIQWMAAGALPSDAICLGPAPAFHRVKAGWAQWQVVLKSLPENMETVLSHASAFPPPPGTIVFLDVDPEGMA
ncbi:MAG: hypothetical protein IPN90_08740 [Elusimicrobia bacterium]|nr:hypothetical protein [Elusimicrobiota bacterium]